MGFFHFVEQDYGIRFSPNLFGELPFLFVPDEARRRADELVDAVFFHIFAHIFVAEKSFRKSLCKFGFPYAGRSDEQESSYRSRRVFNAGHSATDCSRYGFNGVVLTDNALMEFVFQPHKLFRFAFREPSYGDSRALFNHLGYILGVYKSVFVRAPL